MSLSSFVPAALASVFVNAQDVTVDLPAMQPEGAPPVRVAQNDLLQGIIEGVLRQQGIIPDNRYPSKPGQVYERDLNNRELRLINDKNYIPNSAIFNVEALGRSSLDGNYYYDIVLKNGLEVCGRNEHQANPKQDRVGATFVQPAFCHVDLSR